MKQIIISVVLFSLLFNLPVCGQIVDYQEAARRAAQFLTARSTSMSPRKAPAKSPVLKRANGNMGDEVYVFNDEVNGGFVVVSSNERMPAILGYSYTDTFREDSIPCGMKMWLEGYANQTRFLEASPQGNATLESNSLGTAISPMISTTWGQDEPYNNMCPTQNGKHSVTGCGATVMAQMMYYYKWPAQTTATIPQYQTDTYDLTMPAIEPTSIDWNSMKLDYKKDYSSKQADAVAKLMLLCGSAVKMDYGLYGSSSYDGNIVMAMKNYFSYSPTACFVDREDYTLTEWESMIYEELSNQKPVIYTGQSNAGGHAFIVDGYEFRGSNNYFHVNWGWDGYQDNYFLFTDLNGYDNKQSALIDLYPLTSKTERPYGVIDGDVLSFYYDNKQDSRTGEYHILSEIEELQDKDLITKCVIDPSFRNYKPRSLKSFFRDQKNLKEIVGLDNINTTFVTDFSNMFTYCTSLETLDLSKWNTGHATKIYHMFWNCKSLKSVNLSGLDTKRVTDMSDLFYDCDLLESIDLSSFNTKNVTNMSYMFSYCKSLTNINLSSFNTEKVTDMSNMFLFCSSLKSLDLSSFNTENVKSMRNMFEYCGSLENLNLSSFNTKNVKDMKNMFSRCESLKDLDLSGFNTEKVTDMSNLFLLCRSLKSLDLSSFNTKNVTNMSSMFSSCGSITSINLRSFRTDNVTNMLCMFDYCESLTKLDLSNFNTEKVTNMAGMFSGCESLASLNLSSFNTTNVTNMSQMFHECKSLASLNMRSFNTTNVTNMANMFSGCESLVSLDLSRFNTTNVTNLASMFWGCKSLANLDISSFNTEKVTAMSHMFGRCSSIKSLDLRNFSTNHVPDLSYMFSGCESLTHLDVSSFNTENVTKMRGTFDNCISLKRLDLSNFNTTNVTDMEYLFAYCSNLETIYASDKWTTRNVRDSYQCFVCPKLVGGLGTAFNESHRDYTYARIDGGPSAPGYFTKIDASKIVDTMTDSGKDALIYNLKGQRLNAPKKGVNIIGKRQVIGYRR